MPVSPDCSNAPFKCGACSGDAWDDDADEMTPCTCPCHAPTPRDPDVDDPALRPPGSRFRGRSVRLLWHPPT